MAAERMKKYRENMKNNPTKRVQYMKKESECYTKRKASGEIKTDEQYNKKEQKEHRSLLFIYLFIRLGLNVALTHQNR